MPTMDELLPELVSEIEQVTCNNSSECKHSLISVDLAQDEKLQCQVRMGDIIWGINASKIAAGGKRYGFEIRATEPKKFQATTQTLLHKTKRNSLLNEFTMPEFLQRLHEFSFLLSKINSNENNYFLESREEEVKRWYAVMDMALLKDTCKIANEALSQAAMAAADLLCNINPPTATASRGVTNHCSMSADGWDDIPGWTVQDEIWAASFRDPAENFLTRRMNLAASAQDSYLQWCEIETGVTPEIPCFSVKVHVQRFLGPDIAPLKIGIATNRPILIKFRNGLIECSQQGISSAASLGLGYLIPKFVKGFMDGAPQLPPHNDDEFAHGFLKATVRYLCNLSMICLVCGRERSGEFVARRSTCEEFGSCRATLAEFKHLAAKFPGNEEEQEQKQDISRRIQFLYRNCVDISELCVDIYELLFQRLRWSLLKHHSGWNEENEQKDDAENAEEDDAVIRIAELNPLVVAQALSSDFVSVSLISLLWSYDD